MFVPRGSFRHSLTLLAAGAFLLLGAGAAQAQGYSGDRSGHWEFSISPLYQGSQNIDFEGGSTVKTSSELGGELAFGYNMSENFTLGFGFQWYGVSYDANVVQETPGTFTRISGTYDSWLPYANVTWNFMEGPLQPYVTAGIGWSFIDTNIPNGLPSTGCWWDPWYGYICTTTYPTKSVDSFAYNAGLGLRYQFNPAFFMRFGYDSKWLDLGKAKSTPRFDQVRLDFGWVF